MPSIADVVDLIETELGDVPVFLGEEYKDENASPPRVVFIPRGDRFMPPSGRTQPTRSPLKSILTRAVGLEARVWGASDPDDTEPESYPELRATELLVDRVLLAVDAVCRGSVQYEDGEWLQASGIQLGRVYLLRFRVGVPVVPTLDAEDGTVTTFTEVLAPAGTPADSPDAIQTTVVLGSDVTGTPSP